MTPEQIREAVRLYGVAYSRKDGEIIEAAALAYADLLERQEAVREAVRQAAEKEKDKWEYRVVNQHGAVYGGEEQTMTYDGCQSGHYWGGSSICSMCGARLRCECGAFVREDNEAHWSPERCRFLASLPPHVCDDACAVDECEALSERSGR